MRLKTPTLSPQEHRTAQVAHYVIARARPNRLGSTKLNKVLWFADLEAYRRTGRTITGQTSYEKRQYGPVPNGIVRAVRQLESDGKIVTRKTPTPTGDRNEMIWLQPPAVAEFTSDEIDILNEAITWVCDVHSAQSISDLTHDALWDETELGQQISVGAASISPDEVTAEDVAWAKQALAAAE